MCDRYFESQISVVTGWHGKYQMDDNHEPWKRFLVACKLLPCRTYSLVLSFRNISLPFERLSPFCEFSGAWRSWSMLEEEKDPRLCNLGECVEMRAVD